MKRDELILFLGLLPLSYIGLLIVGAGDKKSMYGVIQEPADDRLVQALLLSLGIALVLWFIRRRDKMVEKTDTAKEAMRFFGKARDVYSAQGLKRESKDCDLIIAMIQKISIDPRIELKFDEAAN